MQSKLITSLEKQLSFQEFKISSILEITKAINSNLPVKQLLSILNFVLTQQLNFTKIVLLHKQDEWNTLLKYGIKGKLEAKDLVSSLNRFKNITTIESSPSPILSQFDFVVPVFHQQVAIAYLLLTDKNTQNSFLTEKGKNMHFIQTLANIIVVAIENQRMIKLQIKQARYKRELEVASELQKLLFPSFLPSNRKVDIAAKYTTRHQVGGDYYDYIPLGEDEFMLCIGDVSGKGIGAAMLMANFQATLRTLIAMNKRNLHELIHELNRIVTQNANGEKFITFFICHYEVDTRKLTYINAGHNHPFISNGKRVISLDKGTIGLGMLPELPFLAYGELILESNSTLVMYTDGIIELENSKNEFFELDRLIKLVHLYYPLKMEDLNNLIFSKLDEWRTNKNFVDDTAVFTCRFF